MQHLWLHQRHGRALLPGLFACPPLALDLADVAVVSLFQELQPHAHAAAY